MGIKFLTFSDLHMGQDGTFGYSHMKRLTKKASEESFDVIVMNGDTIEIKDIQGSKQEILDSVKKSVELVKKFVEAAIEKNRAVKIHYMFGNHDCYHELKNLLQSEIADQHPDNFFIDKDYLKVGKAIFTHGDLNTDFCYHNDKAHLLSGLKGELKSQPGVINRVDKRADVPQYLSVKDSLWKNIEDNIAPNPIVEKLRSIKLILKNSLDQHLSSAVFKLKDVTSNFIKSFENTGMLDDVTHAFLGHYHPKANTVIEDGGIIFSFTGASTFLHPATYCVGEINDDGKICKLESHTLSKALLQTPSAQGQVGRV